MSNYEKIKNSVDVRCHKYNLKLVLIASAVCMAVISAVIGVFLIMNPQARYMHYWISTAVFVIAFIPSSGKSDLANDKASSIVSGINNLLVT